MGWQKKIIPKHYSISKLKIPIRPQLKKAKDLPEIANALVDRGD
jgi:hypothetical protein